MLLNRNIKTKNPNSLYHLLIGLIFVGMTAWVAIKGDKKILGIDQFDWVYIALFGFAGVWFTIKGLKAIFSKAYIKVDPIEIHVKSDESSQAIKIYWNEIEKIQNIKRNFVITLKDKTEHTIYFSHFDYVYAEELRSSIQQMAQSKDITIINEDRGKYVKD